MRDLGVDRGWGPGGDEARWVELDCLFPPLRFAGRSSSATASKRRGTTHKRVSIPDSSSASARRTFVRARGAVTVDELARASSCS